MNRYPSAQWNETCARFNAEWSEASYPPDLGDEFAQRKDERCAELFAMLLAIDIRHRRKRSLVCDREYYKSRFPQFADAIDVTFAIGQTVSLLPDSFAGETDDELSETLDRDSTRVIPPLDDMAGDADGRGRKFGDYEVLEVVARGGMGVVFKATQTSLNRIVALKMILSGQLAGPQEIKRFKSEAEAAAKLDHSGIVPIYEIGEYQGQHYFSMGFVEGQSLAHRLREGPLSAQVSADLLLKVCDAVAYAHECGIVHRDLKPGNILIDGNGMPKVTDFGLAKQVAAESDLTRTGQVLGTPSFMPPEQACGDLEEIGPASDVYSLGAILYCLLTGRPPFQAATSMDTLLQVLQQEPVGPRTLNPQVPKELEVICLKCLNKELNKRYGSANELALDLKRYLVGEPILARPTPRLERAWKWCKRKPAIAGFSFAMALLLLVMVVGGVYLHRSTDAKRLVAGLLDADITEVPSILREVEEYPILARSDLLQAYVHSGDSTERLHAAMALVDENDSAFEYLKNRLLTVAPNQFEVVVRVLREHATSDRLGDHYGAIVRDAQQDDDRRMRAACALATIDPDNQIWRHTEVTDDLAGCIVNQSALSLPVWIESLRPVREHLIPSFGKIFRSNAVTRTPAEIAMATDVLEDLASDDPELLASLLLTATPQQMDTLFDEFVAHSDTATQLMLSALNPSVDLAGALSDSDLGVESRAATILLRMNETSPILDLMQRDLENVEVITQFVHRCRASGVTPTQIWLCLQRAAKLRESVAGQTDEREKRDRAMYGLLLAMGEFQLDEFADPNQEVIKKQLIEWYANHPSSAVHGAAGWLLRQWKCDDEVDRVDHTPVPFDETLNRDWYVIEVETNSSGPSDVGSVPIYFTMIVFPPDENVFQVGQDNDEKQELRFTRPYALSDREVTWQQFNNFDASTHYETWERFHNLTLAAIEPVWGASWFDAVAYCRWLTTQAGLPEDEQCFAVDPLQMDSDPRDGWVELPNSTHWPIETEKHGFRLPTEAEWHRACRSGTRTAYFFGDDADSLDRYAWFLENSEGQIQVVGQLRPNPRGMFDMSGNVNEWCYDWFGAPVFGDDPTGPETGADRVFRGGAFSEPAMHCRTGWRRQTAAGQRSFLLGFRIAVTPQVQEFKRHPSRSSEKP